MTDPAAIRKKLAERMEAVLDHLHRELSTFRTGRASLAVLEGVVVDYYGTPTPLRQMASLSMPESRLITIQPWDVNSVQAIEKAILAANLGLTLLGRGEFSLIPASLATAAGLDPRIGPFVALYVLVLAVVSPVLASNARRLADVLPDRLFTSDWTYVRGETMSTACGHLAGIEPAVPAAEGCPTCLAAGDAWVELRSCLTCGEVGCCDDSPSRHATAHFEATGHPLIRTLQPGQHWVYCYLDEVLVHAPDVDDAPSAPPAEDAGGVRGGD
jgi:hypothetical protein